MHPIRQLFVDAMNSQPVSEKITYSVECCYGRDLHSHYDNIYYGINLSFIKIDASNIYEAYILLYDYFNQNARPSDIIDHYQQFVKYVGKDDNANLRFCFDIMDDNDDPFWQHRVQLFEIYVDTEFTLLSNETSYVLK